MQAINISLPRNDSEQNWRVEIDGRLHDHVSTQTLDNLVQFALVAAHEGPSTERRRNRLQ
jgi:hypothetical protein